MAFSPFSFSFPLLFTLNFYNLLFPLLLSYLHIVSSFFVLIVTPSLSFLLSTFSFWYCTALNHSFFLLFLILLFPNFSILSWTLTRPLPITCSILAPLLFLALYDGCWARPSMIWPLYTPQIYSPHPPSHVWSLALPFNHLISFHFNNLYCYLTLILLSSWLSACVFFLFLITSCPCWDQGWNVYLLPPFLFFPHFISSLCFLNLSFLILCFLVFVACYAMWMVSSGGIILWQYPLFRTGLVSRVLEAMVVVEYLLLVSGRQSCGWLLMLCIWVV